MFVTPKTGLVARVAKCIERPLSWDQRTVQLKSVSQKIVFTRGEGV